MWRAVTANAWSGLKRSWPDVVILCWLVVLSLWVRRLTLMDIEGGGDAVRKWFFVKQWSYANSFADIEWNHHLARFGVNIWAFIVQKLWGTSASSYYIAPMCAASAGVAFCYKLGQELGGRYAGVLSALWLMTLEPMERLGSQLLPAAFSAAYVAGAAYFLLWYLRYEGDKRWRRVLLVVTALFLFFAYLSKMSNLLFVPGFLLALWFLGGNRRDLLIFAGILLGLYLVETAWYSLFTEHATRFEIVTNSHRGGTVKNITHSVTRGGGHGRGARHVEKVVDYVAVFWKLTERYRVLWESIKFPLYLFLGSSLALAFFAGQRAAKAMALVVFGYLFQATFAIRQFDPLKVWMSNEPRYFVVLCPLLLATDTAFVLVLLKRAKHWAKQRVPGRFVRGFFLLGSRFAPAWALLFGLLIGLRYYNVEGHRALEREYPFRNLRRFEEYFNDAYARGLPIVEKHSRYKKALRLVYSVYLDENLIERDGKLPSFEEAVKRLDTRYDWLSTDPSKYLKRARQDVRRNRKCVYTTRIRGRNLSVVPRVKLSDRCDRGRSPSG